MKKQKIAFLAVFGVVVLVASAVAANMAPSRSALVAARDPVVVSVAAPIYMANGKILTNVHEVIGRVKGTSPVTVTLSGGARFFGADTFFCTAAGADDSQTLGPQVVNVNGSQFRIVHASAEPATVTYRCLGM
jgi:hypothetical protein